MLMIDVCMYIRYVHIVTVEINTKNVHKILNFSIEICFCARRQNSACIYVLCLINLKMTVFIGFQFSLLK